MKKVTISHPLQSSFSISTNDDALLCLLKLKYGKYLLEDLPHADHTLCVARHGNGYSFASNFYSNTTNTPLHEIDRYIFDQTTYDDRVLALHGAAVEWKQEAYLFLAATTSGKTTLTSYLTHCECGYLTDDCILIDRESFSVHPFTTPIHLRDGGLEVLKNYHATPNGLALLEEGQALRRWVYTPAKCIETAIPLKKIFFIERTDSENSLTGMNATERITALMKSPITNYNVTGDYLRLLARLAKIDCHILRYCDMNYVKELIQNG